MELDLIEKGNFHFQVVDLEENVIIFGVHMSFSAHIDNKKKNDY